MSLNIIIKGPKPCDNRVIYDHRRKDIAMTSQRPDLRIKNLPEEDCRYWNQILDDNRKEYRSL